MNKKKIKNSISYILLLVFLVSTPLDAYGAQRVHPGDESPAEENQFGVTSDIYAYRSMESVLYPAYALFFATSGFFVVESTSKGVFKKIIDAMVKRYSNKFGAIAIGSTGTSMIPVFNWMNWPPSKFIFSNAPAKNGYFVDNFFDNSAHILLNNIANFLFMIAKALVMLGNNIVILAFDTTWATSLADWISDSTSALVVDFTGNGPIGFARVLFVLCLAALAVTIARLLIKGQLIRAGSASFIAMLSIAAVYIYVANCSIIINSTAEFTDGVAGMAMAATYALDEENFPGSDNLNYIEKGLVSATNGAWTTLIAEPWCIAQFGTDDVSRLKLSDEEWEAFRKSLGNGGTPASGVGKILGENDMKNRPKYIDTIFLGSDDPIRSDLLKVLSDSNIKHGEHPQTVSAVAANYSSAFYHVIVATLTTIPSAAYFALTLFLAIPVILAQIFVLILLVFLPIGIILGVAGEHGQQLALSYLKRLIGCFSIKIIYGFYLSLILFFANMMF